MQFRKILQLQEPEPGEPLCSGIELTAFLGQRLDMAHYHTVVTVRNNRARAWFSTSNQDNTLDCAVTINGREYETQQFNIKTEDIGKTLFCAGFPCLTITGLDTETGAVTVTLSEIVEPCGPESCPR
ncbi:MAG: hypothetical protein IPK73_01135 [Candidatus Obscuribacter sp.]|nr:hypothetical protein [Candidatus Obscuribacter sp.]MBK9280396.1 hypothetical protein [Candidatus Obscuribacter sp.]